MGTHIHVEEGLLDRVAPSEPDNHGPVGCDSLRDACVEGIRVPEPAS